MSLYEVSLYSGMNNYRRLIDFLSRLDLQTSSKRGRQNVFPPSVSTLRKKVSFPHIYGYALVVLGLIARPDSQKSWGRVKAVSMAYLVPIHGPTSVRHAIKLKFLDPKEDCLVVA
jgi:hypothetical protein